MTRVLVVLSVLIIMFSLVSCGTADKNALNDMPEIGVRAKDWNTSFKLVEDPVISNSHQNGQDLTLRVENLSDTPIVFQENFGLRVMTKDASGWRDIQNNSYNSGEQYLPTKASYPLGLLVSVLPYVPNLASHLDIRIIIIGHAEDNDKELLGAYLDVTINP